MKFWRLRENGHSKKSINLGDGPDHILDLKSRSYGFMLRSVGSQDV